MFSKEIKFCPEEFNSDFCIVACYAYAIFSPVTKKLLNHKAHISRNLIPDSMFILFVTFSAHFLYGPLQQIKKQFTVTLKFRNERLSKY